MQIIVTDINAGKAHTTAWDEFASDNADGIDAGELAEIQAKIEAGATVPVGMGYTVEPVPTCR